MRFMAGLAERKNEECCLCIVVIVVQTFRRGSLSALPVAIQYPDRIMNLKAQRILRPPLLPAHLMIFILLNCQLIQVPGGTLARPRHRHHLYNTGASLLAFSKVFSVAFSSSSC